MRGSQNRRCSSIIGPGAAWGFDWGTYGAGWAELDRRYGPLAGTIDTSATDAFHSGEDGIGFYNLALAGDTDGNLEIVTGAPDEMR